MMKVVIVFKSGKELCVNCKKFRVEYDARNRVKSLLWHDVHGRTPFYVDAASVACVYREAEGDM